MKYRLSALICGASALALSTAAWAAEDRDGRSDNDQDATIIVTGKAEKPFEDNADIKRSENDAQPYVIIGRDEIRNSGATSMDEFIRRRLSMDSTMLSGPVNATGGGTAGAGAFEGSASSINLRGFGPSQTLILINGRRQPGIGSRGTATPTSQPNLNAIPINSIERIEILPSSASAIYGSGAIGGVVNVILRKDYQGVELNLGYEDSTRFDVPTLSADLSAGFHLEGGRTRVMLSGSYRHTGELLMGDRGFAQRGREAILRNNPGSIFNPRDARTGGPAQGVAPPFGNLINIRSYNGQTLVGKDGTVFNNNYTHLPGSYRGYAVDGIAPLKANDGTYNLDLAQNGLSTYSRHASLLPENSNWAASISVTRDFTDNLEVFAEYGYSAQKSHNLIQPYSGAANRIAAGAPNNPFNQDILVSYPVDLASYTDESIQRSRNNIHRATIGATWRPIKSWTINADYSFGRQFNTYEYQRGYSVPLTLDDQILNGTIDILKGDKVLIPEINRYNLVNITPSTTFLHDFALRATGDLFGWYAGKARLATGLEHRRYTNRRHGVSFGEFPIGPGAPPPPPIFKQHQQISSVYGELTVPFVSPDLHVPGIYSFEVTAAGRYEKFSVKSPPLTDTDIDAFTPTFAIKYQPTESLILRGSYAKGFVAPDYATLGVPAKASTPTTTIIVDPRFPGQNNDQTTNPIYLYTGGNPNIKPEKTTSWNAGIVIAPRSGTVRLSLDYYYIEKSNQIGTLSAQEIVYNESLYPGRVVRGPNGRITEIYANAVNVFGVKTAGVDFALDYIHDLSKLGSLSLNVNGTWIDYFKQKLLLTAPEQDVVGIINKPLKFRVGAAAVWSHEAFSIGWDAQYYDSYLHDTAGGGRGADPGTVIKNQGAPGVSSQMYHNAFVRVPLTMIKGIGMSRAPEITFGIKNLFDKKPPLDMSQGGGFFSKYGDPRLRRFYLNLRVGF